MKILEITHSFVRSENDFISRFLLTLFEGLDSRGMKIKVIAPHAEGLEEEEIIGGIEVERFRYASDDYETLAYKGNMHEAAFSSPLSVSLLLKFIASAYIHTEKNIGEYDLVHLHWWIPFGVPISFLIKRYKKPFVISLHGTDVRLIKKVKPLRFILKWLERRVDKFVVVSDFIRKTLLSCGIDESKLEVIPMPVEDELFFPEEHNNDRNIILTIARFSKQKRIDRIIEVARKFEGKNVEFHIVGSGEREKEIRSVIKNYGLTNMKLIPPMSRELVAKKIRESDIFLLLSDDEGFGMVAVESMLSGVPVILNRSGGFLDIVEDGVNGLLVDGDDYDEVARNITELLGNNRLRNRIINNGLETGRSYTREKIANRFRNMFLKIQRD